MPCSGTGSRAEPGPAAPRQPFREGGEQTGQDRIDAQRLPRILAPSYHEASLILECRKLYWQDLDPAGFVDAAIQEHYPANDYHRIYFGEILAAFRV